MRTEAQKEKHREAERHRRAANPKKYREADRQLYNTNPGKGRARCAARRARKLNQSPPLTVEQQADIVAFYAKARALTELVGEPYHVDHIKPLSKGGLHHPDNLQVLLGRENLRKGSKYV